jgi:hypothetical protein
MPMRQILVAAAALVLVSSALGSRRRNKTDAAAASSLGRSSRWRSGTEAVVAGRSWRAHPTALAWAAAALHCRSSVEFQWFLTELSVRLWSIRAMVAHLLPCRASNLPRLSSLHLSPSVERRAFTPEEDLSRRKRGTERGAVTIEGLTRLEAEATRLTVMIWCI